MRQLSNSANNINWLINSFVEQVPGVTECVVVSADGLPMAMSHGLAFGLRKASAIQPERGASEAATAR